MKVADPFVVEAIRRVALHIAQMEGQVTADDVRQAMPHVPYKRSTMGAAFRSLQQHGELVPTGYTPSRVAQNHGRSIKTYRLPGAKCP